MFERLQALPVLLVILATFPLFVLAVWRNIFPNSALVFLLAIPFFCALAVFFQANVLPIILALDLAIVLAAAGDLLSLPTQACFTAERQTQRVVSLGQAHDVCLTINNHDQREHLLGIRDDSHEQLTAKPDEFTVRVPPNSRCVLRYELMASRRGSFQLTHVHLRARSRLGFWKRHMRWEVKSTLHVYPDLKQLSDYALLARTDRLSLMGVRRTRRIGQDNEFERLRDYTRDDNFKHIDWRSTARRHKLTVKDYQASQSQRLIFLVDCGRMMTNESAGLSLLDHSLNAVLMLSFVALRQGDSVGLVTFSDSIHSFVPPHGGMNQLNRLLHATFDRFPRLVESRFDQAFVYLASRCRKRSLVVLVTNAVDEVNSRQIQQYLASQVGRHLPVGVLLRDHRLFDTVQIGEARERNLYEAAAAADILAWRHQMLCDLHHNGVLVLDVFPEQMTAPLVNQYLDIKARHLL